jgi:hypothetical protein
VAALPGMGGGGIKEWWSEPNYDILSEFL